VLGHCQRSVLGASFVIHRRFLKNPPTGALTCASSLIPSHEMQSLLTCFGAHMFIKGCAFLWNKSGNPTTGHFHEKVGVYDYSTFSKKGRRSRTTSARIEPTHVCILLVKFSSLWCSKLLFSFQCLVLWSAWPRSWSTFELDLQLTC